MGIFETVCTIISTICCTLKKYEIAEDINIKIDDVHNIEHKREERGDNNFVSQEYINTTDIIKIIIEPVKGDSESLKKNSQNSVLTNNSETSLKLDIMQQQQNSSEREVKLQIRFVMNNKQHSDRLSDLDESHKHNVSSVIDDQNSTKVISEAAEVTRLLQPQLPVMSSTHKNSQSNCSADNSITNHKENIQNKINKNEACPLTKIDSKCTCKWLSFVKLRKHIAEIFRQRTLNK